jgi:uncharacterized protein YndB with AHSA1/START domain
MFRYQQSIIIDRPPSEVFDYLTSVEKIPEWVPTTTEAWALSEGPVVKGFRLAEIVVFDLKFYQIRNRLEWKITEVEEDRLVEFKNRSGIGQQIQIFSLEQAGGGTELTVVGVHSLRGPLRLVEPIFRMVVTQGRQAHLETIKRILETGESGR